MLGNSTEIFTPPVKYVAAMVDISGRSGDGFGKVKDAFAENFAVEGDVGASVAVTIDGELVVDLWGGTQDDGRHRAVGGGHDHQRVLDDEDDVVPVAAGARQPRPRRRRRAGGPLLAGVRRGRQGGHGARAPPAVAHGRAAELGPAPRADRPLRLGPRVRAARQAGAVVGAGLEVRATTASPRATSSARSCAASTAAASARSSPRRSPGRSAPTSTSAPAPSTTTASPS